MNLKIIAAAIIAIIGVVVFFMFDPSSDTDLIENKSASLDEKIKDQKLVADPSCRGFLPEPCGPIILSGKSNSESLIVFLVNQGFEFTDFASLVEATKQLDTPSVSMKTVTVSAGFWTTSFNDYVGDYRVLLYDSSTKEQLFDTNIIVN